MLARFLVAIVVMLGSACTDQGPRYAWHADGNWIGVVGSDTLTLQLAESNVDNPNATVSGTGTWRSGGTSEAVTASGTRTTNRVEVTLQSAAFASDVLLDALLAQGNRSMTGSLFATSAQIPITLKR